MLKVVMGRAGEPGMGTERLEAMYRLRAEVFHERLRWDVRVEQGREHDWFDLLGPRYVLLESQGNTGRVMGCCRLLPSLGPNMLRDIFSELLDGNPCPAGRTVWEVSRFAMSRADCQSGFGMRQASAMLVSELLHYAASQSVEALVGVTSTGFARLLENLGLGVERLGRERRIGTVGSLAFRLALDDANLRAVARHHTPHRLPMVA
jgi:acyl homoserine lactone synthase